MRVCVMFATEIVCPCPILNHEGSQTMLFFPKKKRKKRNRETVVEVIHIMIFSVIGIYGQ